MARYLVHAPGLASRSIGGEEVIVSPRAGKVWSLNPAGALVWELADGSMELEEIARVFSIARGADPAAAMEEIEEFAAGLVQMNLMSWREVPSTPTARTRRAAESAPGEGELSEPPALVHEEQLQVLAGGCDSSHSGQGAACMLVGSCASGFS